MKVAIYIRVSTDMQVEDGFSIEGQRTRLTSYAESQDWEIYDFYIDDGYSAKDTNRPEMKRMMQDMEDKKFEIILVYKLDRLTRSVADLHALLKTFDIHGVKFKSATEIFETTTAMGRFFITLVGAMAEWERGTISERVRFGIEQMVAEGRRPGGLKPFGYTKDEILIPEEAELIREVRELYLSGLGYKSIAMHMNHNGKLRRGREWEDSTVEYTLENPYYAGMIRIASKTPDGKYVNQKRDTRVKCIYGQGSHEPVYSMEEYEEIKEMMERKTFGGFSKIQTYWFTSVLRCGRCGGAMYGRMSTKMQRKSGIKRSPQYICANRHHKHTCDMPTFRQVHVEHLVMQYINKVQLDTEKLKKETDNLLVQETKKTSELDKAKRELSKLNERREKWQYMFVEGIISKEQIREKMGEEDRNEQEIKQRIANAQRSLSGIPKVTELANLSEVWELLDDAEKKEYIYTLFRTIVIDTPLTNPKGVKNKFFEAQITEVQFN